MSRMMNLIVHLKLCLLLLVVSLLKTDICLALFVLLCIHFFQLFIVSCCLVVTCATLKMNCLSGECSCFHLQIDCNPPYLKVPELHKVDLVATRPDLLVFADENKAVMNACWSLRDGLLASGHLHKKYSEGEMAEIKARYPELYSFRDAPSIIPRSKKAKLISMIGSLSPIKHDKKRHSQMIEVILCYVVHLFSQMHSIVDVSK